MREQTLSSYRFVSASWRRKAVLAVCVTALCAPLSGGAWAQAKDLSEFIRNPVPEGKAQPTERREEHQTNMDAFDLSIELSQDEALWTALAFEDAGQVRGLLNRGANPNRAEELTLMTPLMAAETVTIAVALLQYGANPSARDRTGRTVLHHAVSMRDGVAISQLLVRRGVDVDIRTDDPTKATPLFIAVQKYIEGNDKDATAAVIRMLVSLGADVNAVDGRGVTPLAVAAFHNQSALVRLLVELGADPTKKLGNGRTPFDYARDANAIDAMRILAELPVKPQSAN